MRAAIDHRSLHDAVLDIRNELGGPLFNRFRRSQLRQDPIDLVSLVTHE
jgi:hypothetical protein